MFLWVLDDDEKGATGRTGSFSPTSTKARVSLSPTVCMTGQLPPFWFQRPLAGSCLLRGEKKFPLSLFFFLSGESFLWLPPPFLLPSVTSKCQPAWETPGDLRSAGREPLKTYTIKFFLPFTLMSYWKARWHFAIMQRAQLRSLVRWNVIHKYVMPGIYWCFAAASASSRSSQGLFFFSAGVSTREETRRTLTKQWSVIIIISSTARSLAQGMWKFIRPHSPYLWEMINCASLHVADWRLPLLSQRSKNRVPASAGCPSYRRNSATSASRASLSIRWWDEKKKRWFSWRFPGEAVLRSCASRAQQSFVLTERGNAVNPVIGWNHAAFFLGLFFPGNVLYPHCFWMQPPHPTSFFFTPLDTLLLLRRSKGNV